jgi:hypothetical protein
MTDNGRRGSELVGGQGSAKHDFLFAELYCLSCVKAGKYICRNSYHKMFAPAEPLNMDGLYRAFETLEDTPPTKNRLCW